MRKELPRESSKMSPYRLPCLTRLLLNLSDYGALFGCALHILVRLIRDAPFRFCLAMLGRLHSCPPKRRGRCSCSSLSLRHRLPWPSHPEVALTFWMLSLLGEDALTPWMLSEHAMPLASNLTAYASHSSQPACGIYHLVVAAALHLTLQKAARAHAC